MEIKYFQLGSVGIIPPSGEYSLYEKNGMILNDTTLVLKDRKNITDQQYKFRKYDLELDSKKNSLNSVTFKKKWWPPIYVSFLNWLF